MAVTNQAIGADGDLRILEYPVRNRVFDQSIRHRLLHYSDFTPKIDTVPDTGSAAEVHVMTEAMRRAYFDRNNALGDPNFIKNPVDRLTSMAYADSLRVTINPGKATSSASLGAGAGAEQHESTNTTHYSIIDRWGNAVALTYTINNNMGAKVIAGKTGYLLNDEMDDFTAKPGSPNIWGLVQGKANAVAPGKRPLSSMAPTIVLKDGNPVLVLGAPGGARILTTVLEMQPVPGDCSYGTDRQRLCARTELTALLKRQTELENARRRPGEFG